MQTCYLLAIIGCLQKVYIVSVKCGFNVCVFLLHAPFLKTRIQVNNATDQNKRNVKSIEYNVFRAKRERKCFPFVCSVEKLFLSLHPQVPQPSVAYEEETSYRGSKIRNLCIITKWKVTKRHSYTIKGPQKYHFT